MRKKANPSVNIDIDVDSHNLGKGKNSFKSNPIKSGYSKQTIQENIISLMREGREHAQAVAIALDSARKSYFKRYPDGFLPSYLRPQSGEGRNPKKYKSNPSKSVDGQIKAAMTLYQKFSGHEPEEVGRMKKPKIPDVGVVIGELEGVAYETVRDGKVEKYFHRFDKRTRPLLVSSSDGRNLYILGGEYDFTEDGIVDATDRKHSPRFKR